VNQWILLLRGINVGGNNPLPMASLKQLLVDLGCEDVQTYIASGNVVLTSPHGAADKLCNEVSAEIEKSHGFAPDITALTVAEFAELAQGNPYKAAQDEPKSLHLYVLAAPPAATAAAELEQLAANGEQIALTDRCLYLHAPNGIGRSKLVAGAEKTLGVSATGRNWRTVTKLLELAGQ
jgi:uncharacterized protein (DUF1697 family)